MMHAEKKCRKLHMGKVPYSPQLITQANRFVLLRALHRKVHGAKVKQATIKILAKNRK